MRLRVADEASWELFGFLLRDAYITSYIIRYFQFMPNELNEVVLGVREVH